MEFHRHGSPAHTHLQPPQPPKIQPSAVSYGVQHVHPCDDAVLYVGKRRQAYHVNPESLIRGSAYFRNLLQHANPRGDGRNPSWPPLVIDCEEGIFENLLLLMRYGTFEALPPMSAAETYQLKKEADFYGITYAEPPQAPRRSTSSDSSGDVSSMSSPRSGTSSSPKSTMNISPPPTPFVKRTFGRHHDGVRVVCSTPQRGLAELPEFPLDLADPGRMVLVSCLDSGKAKFYTCDCRRSDGSCNGTTQWALNFHHRHAFCTACGGAAKMSAKHFAEMFMAAATHYSTEQGMGATLLAGKWQVGCDSTCLLRFVSSAGDGPDACGCTAGGVRANKAVPPTVWAASSYYSHAFCTGCSEAADGPVLLGLMLALRFGGGHKGSKSARFTGSPRAPSHPHLGR